MKQPRNVVRGIPPRTPASTPESMLDQADAPKRTDGPSHEQIARRANELYLERGQQEGHDVEDWLRAENELVLARRADRDEATGRNHDH